MSLRKHIYFTAHSGYKNKKHQRGSEAEVRLREAEQQSPVAVAAADASAPLTHL